MYLPSLFGNFVWDDEDFVYANQYVKEFRVEKFFTSSITEGRGKGSNYFRPMQYVIYSTAHALFGFNPFWYHLTNVLVHIAAAAAIFYFFALLIRPPTFAFLISLIFLVHPVQTEAVSYISGLSDPLYVLFGFLSLIFASKTRKTAIVSKAGVISLLFFLLSLLSKETGLVFFGLIALYSFLTSILTHIDERINVKFNATEVIRKVFSRIFAYGLIAIIYLWYHYTYINNFDIKGAWGNNLYSNSLAARLILFTQNIYTYLTLLFFPKDLFMERDLTIKIQTVILNPKTIIFVLVNSIIVLYFIHKFRTNNFVLLMFFYLAFWICWIPYSGLVLINGIFYEHFLYLPLVFFFGFLITLVNGVIARGEATKQSVTATKNRLPRSLRSLAMTGLALWLIVLAGRNIVRQYDWIDNERFYKQTLSYVPDSLRMRNGLGMVYADKGDMDGAIREYSIALQKYPSIPTLYHNLGNAYASKGEINKAEQFYLQAINLDPKFAFSYQALANLYQQTGQKEKLAAFLKHSNLRVAQ